MLPQPEQNSAISDKPEIGIVLCRNGGVTFGRALRRKTQMTEQYGDRRNVGAAGSTAAVDGSTPAHRVHRWLALTGLSMLLIAAGSATSFAQVRHQVRSHLAEAVPSYDVQSICKESIDPTIESRSGCESDESAARNQLVGSWSQYPSAERMNCVAAMPELPSYVELLTCLQISRDADNEKAEQKAGTPPSRSVPIPRGSSEYVPPSLPANSPPLSTPPAVQPYTPPPITTFSDRVNSAIQSYPLQKGIGNNPTDMQEYIRQKSN
jgi:hypothetical protein